MTKLKQTLEFKVGLGPHKGSVQPIQLINIEISVWTLKLSSCLQIKEISLLNDVIKELQHEKDSHAEELVNFRAEIRNFDKKLLAIEEDKSKLERLNATKEVLIQELRNEIQEHKRKIIKEEVVVTEVNECEEQC